MKSLNEIRAPERHRKYMKIQNEVGEFYEENGDRIVAEMGNDAVYLPSAMQGRAEHFPPADEPDPEQPKPDFRRAGWEVAENIAACS